MSPPRLFISYSWSSQEHELWVVDLGTKLRDSGIDVILDKWDLREGHDSISFMEKMVTDATIEKVVIVADRRYVEKADGRKGGVGTETQIISREVYEKQDQSKFVVVLSERDQEGKPFLPTYYKGRIYIDLSSSESYVMEFERLLRWVFNKPLHVKPEIGKAPEFLDGGSEKSLGTSLLFRRSLDALRNGKPFMEGAVDEYLEAFSDNLERFRIVIGGATSADEQVVSSVEEFAAYKNEFVQMFLAVAQYAATEEMRSKIHRFFERLLSYFDAPEGMNSYHSWSFDNFKYIVHELFLYAIAILIRYERFEFADQMLATPYYVGTGSRRGRDAAVGFSGLREYMESFSNRDRKLSRLSSRADLLKHRAETSGFDFRWLMQADFVLYLRASLDGDSWWPETLVYAVRSYAPMEVFARSRSASYYHKLSKVLRGKSPEELKAHLSQLQGDRQRVPQWDFDRISPTTLVGIDMLASKP